MPSHEVIVVGGGIAGLSVAWNLARAGVKDICVVEREWACGTHASGTNAAIFRDLDFDETAVTLSRRSRELMHALAPDLLRQTGAIYLASEALLRRAEAVAAGLGVTTEWLSPPEVTRRFPVLEHNAVTGAFLPEDGVIDTHAMLEALKRAIRDRGGVVRTHAAVAGIDRSEGQFRIRVARGETLAAPRLVLAGGAWSAELAEIVGYRMPVEPRRRHLVLLEPVVGIAPSHAVVWRLENEVYFRPESGGVLASPCDEEPWPASESPRVDQEPLGRLGELLGGLAPSLAAGRVRRAWSCLRSFAPDREFVAGADPRVVGLFWLAGLGGRGMTCGLALGEIVAAALLGHGRAMPQLSPARFAAVT